MSRTKALSVAVAVAITAGVAWAAEHVYTEMDPSFNPASYKTYYWAKTDPMPSNSIMNSRIMADVDAGMISRGWTKAPEGQADLAVVVNVTTKPEQKLETFYTGWDGWAWGGWGPAETVVRTYLKGTLVVDLFDANTKKLVWRGTADRTISDNPQKNAERVDKDIREMFGKKFIEED